MCPLTFDKAIKIRPSFAYIEASKHFKRGKSLLQYLNAKYKGLLPCELFGRKKFEL